MTDDIRVAQLLVEAAAYCLPRWRKTSDWIGRQCVVHIPGEGDLDTGMIVDCFQGPGGPTVYLIEIDGRPEAPAGRGYRWPSPTVVCYAPDRWVREVL